MTNYTDVPRILTTNYTDVTVILVTNYTDVPMILLAWTLGAWLGVDGARLGACPVPCPAWRLYTLFVVSSLYPLSFQPFWRLACPDVVPCPVSSLSRDGVPFGTS